MLRRAPRAARYSNVDKVAVDGDSEVTVHLKAPQPAARPKRSTT